MNGNFIFRDDILSVIDAGDENAKFVAVSDMCVVVSLIPFRRRRQKIREILAAPNYTDYGKPAVLFTFDNFDEALTRRRLSEALASTASVRSGAKGHVTPLQSIEDLDSTKPPLRKNEKRVREFKEGEPGFWEETQKSGKDKAREALCAHCGSPGKSLALCSGCKEVRYVSFANDAFTEAFADNSLKNEDIALENTRL